MLAFFSISVGLWGNFRQLWLQDNNFAVTNISNILSIGTFISVIIIGLIGKYVKLDRLKNPNTILNTLTISNFAKLDKNLIDDFSFINKFLDRIEEYKAKEAEEDDTEGRMAFYEKKYMLRCFRFFYLHREFIDALITAGMGDLFLAKITAYLVQKWVDIETGTREEILKISAFAGAIYNMYREWSKGDFLEYPEDVAAILYDLKK